ncbi:MAG TPA: SRPBCC domain-containing protein [Devosia sp.]|nr:SRPBCC domain-containing protein [Devosia sp.]
MIPPLRRALTVPLEPLLAFDLFVRRLPEWWPLSTRSVWLEAAVACRVDPREGGRIVEEGPDGAEEHWGTIRRMNEPSDVLLDWHPGLTPEHSTEVEVWFKPQPGGTELTLEHRHWERLGARGDFVRSLYENGWGPVLARFAARATEQQVLPPAEGPGCIGAEPPPGWAAARLSSQPAD